MLILFEKKNNTDRIENGNVEVKEENESEVIATLRKQIELSKEIEEKLDKRLKEYMVKWKNQLRKGFSWNNKKNMRKEKKMKLNTTRVKSLNSSKDRIVVG